MFPGAVAQVQIVELMVPLCCTKCEEKVKKALLEMEGEPQLLHLKLNHQNMRNVLWKILWNSFLQFVHNLSTKMKAKSFVGWLRMMLHLKTKNWEKEKENYNAHMWQLIILFFPFLLAVGMLFRGGKGEDWSGESNGDCDWSVCESHASAQAGKEDQEAVGVDYA